jgi:hypothetical protein
MGQENKDLYINVSGTNYIKDFDKKYKVDQIGNIIYYSDGSKEYDKHTSSIYMKELYGD